MSIKNQHIIQKHSIEINFESMEDSFGLQNEIAEVFYTKLQPKMEALFDEIFDKNKYASLDRLEIDCGMLNAKNWEDEFADHAIRKLREELIQMNKKEIDTEKIEETAATEAFFFYLENGFMPWNNRFNTIAELEELLKVNENLVARLKGIISQKSKVPERLAWQFSKNFTSRIITEITRDAGNTLSEIYAILDDLNLLQTDTHSYRHIDKHIVDTAILNLFASDQNKDKVDQFFSFLLSKIEGNEELSEEIKEIIFNQRKNRKNEHLPKKEKELKPGKTKETDTEETDKSIQNEKDKELENREQESEHQQDAIYINNAGLILLHPFLQSLFENLQLTKEDLWINSDSQQLAVLVAEFLVTGSNKFTEFDLVLNKVLCGMDPVEIVTTRIELTNVIISECEALLKEVIQHWSVLKNTGIDGLRDTFLQRNGKLSKVDNHWLLQVEHNAVDVLLAHLPWGIGIVKLPWMNEMLYVEWT